MTNFRAATDAELLLVHTADYVEEVKGYKSEATEKVFSIPENWPSYTSDHAFLSASWAVGCVLNMVTAVMSGQVSFWMPLV